jgi:hypothetical protein
VKHGEGAKWQMEGDAAKMLRLGSGVGITWYEPNLNSDNLNAKTGISW